MKPALVILAAGASRRLGECKALVDLGGRSALELLVAAGAALDEVPPLVVTGADDRAIRAAIRVWAPGGVELLHNPEWQAGRTGGVRRARDARPGRDLVIAPVDCPLIPAAVFEALVDAWVAAGSPPRGWLGTRHGAAHGHPVLVGRGLLADLDGLEEAAPLRRLRAAADPLWSVEAPGPEVLDDLDDGEDLAKLRRRLAEGPSEPA